jgi:hypothetical protein
MACDANYAAQGIGGVACVFGDRIFEFNRQVEHGKKHVLDGAQDRIDVLNLQLCSFSGAHRLFAVISSMARAYLFIDRFVYNLTLGPESARKCELRTRHPINDCAQRIHHLSFGF